MMMSVDSATRKRKKPLDAGEGDSKRVRTQMPENVLGRHLIPKLQTVEVDELKAFISGRQTFRDIFNPKAHALRRFQ